MRFPPFSTYKIPHTLLALETGVLDDPAAMRPHDPAKHPAQDWWPKAWTQPADLETAFRNSVVWYYQDIAESMQVESITDRLLRWGYGNALVSQDLTTYWLGEPLEISAMEQIQFLQKLHADQSPVDKEHLAILDRISLVEARGGKQLHAKTGTGEHLGRWIGWQVGWVVLPHGRRDYFAVICLDRSFDRVRAERAELLQQVLKDLQFR